MAEANRVKTGMKFGDKEYALVPDRILKFREETKNGDISTTPMFQADGGLVFQATVVKDRSDDTSARATGTAYYTAADMKQKKAFEKLETISVGRALSMLGYLNDGQVASTEELEEFYDQKAAAEKAVAIENAIASFEQAKNLESLRQAFIASNLMQDPTVVAAKDARKKELEDEAAKAKPDGNS